MKVVALHHLLQSTIIVEHIIAADGCSGQNLPLQSPIHQRSGYGIAVSSESVTIANQAFCSILGDFIG